MTGMLRRTPMARGSGFKRPAWLPAPPAPPRRVERSGVIVPVSDIVVTVDKVNALQHQGYMALVRKLPCARCGVVGFSQFCHADFGKGTGIKTDCRRGWPGCGPRPGIPGCHFFVGTSGTLPQAERRAVELEYAIKTRALILAAGTWPKRLPLWAEK